jgi:hypothetical protein
MKLARLFVISIITVTLAASPSLARMKFGGFGRGGGRSHVGERPSRISERKPEIKNMIKKKCPGGGTCVDHGH